MEQLFSDDVVPRAVVFGRLPNFPWWPAVVGRCPATNEWKDSEGRHWVFFFNVRHGAWMNIRDLRPFSAATQEGMTEINNLDPDNHAYSERVLHGCALAHEFVLTSGRARPLCEYCPRLTTAALDLPENLGTDPSLAMALDSPPGASSVPPVETPPTGTRPADPTPPEKMQRRPRRTRQKSIRTLDIEEILESRANTRAQMNAQDTPNGTPPPKIDEGASAPAATLGGSLKSRRTRARRASSSIPTSKQGVARISSSDGSTDKTVQFETGKPPAARRKGTGSSLKSTRAKVGASENRKRPAVNQIPELSKLTFKRRRPYRGRPPYVPPRRPPVVHPKSPVRGPPNEFLQTLPAEKHDGDESASTDSEDDMEQIRGLIGNKAIMPGVIADNALRKWLAQKSKSAVEPKPARPSAKERLLRHAQARLDAMGDSLRILGSTVRDFKADADLPHDPRAQKMMDEVQQLVQKADEFIASLKSDGAKTEKEINELLDSTLTEGMPCPILREGVLQALTKS